MPAKPAKKRTRRTGRSRAAQLPRAADEGRESLDFYLQEISRIPLLTVAEETALARRAFRGDVEAQEKLARHNVRFVVSVAKKFQNRGVPLMDLIGEGNLGLMTAARKFDPDRGVKFISYAVWWIRQAIQAAIARHGRPVRVPLNRTADLNRLGRTTTLLTEKLGRVPTTEELVKATGLTRDAVRALERASHRGDAAGPSGPRGGRARPHGAVRPAHAGGDRRHDAGQQPDDRSGCGARRAPGP